MELYEALQNGVDRQKLIDDFVAQLHEAETRIEAEEKAKKEKELAAQKEDTDALEKAYEELKTATIKYWNLYAKIHPEDDWLAKLVTTAYNIPLNKQTKKVKKATYQVSTQSDDEIIRRFISGL